VTGWADWSDTQDAPKKLGMAHALLNGGATIAYSASLVARRTGSRRAGVVYAMAGYGLMTAAAYLGGELSLGMNLGAKHTAIPIFPPDEFTAVLDDADLEAGTPARVDFAGIPLLLLRSGETIHAIGAACTHRGAPLERGTLEDGCVRCPWHGSVFALDDGSVIEGPATFAQPCYETRITNGRIEVRAAH
jgi:nitrite reductase/ring-hydroxylating ferredoxin subunit